MTSEYRRHSLRRSMDVVSERRNINSDLEDLERTRIVGKHEFDQNIEHPWPLPK